MNQLSGRRQATRILLLLAGTFSVAVSGVGCKTSQDKPEGAQPTPVSAESGIVKITVNDHGFSPSSVQAKQGQPLTLEFTRLSDKTCATQVAFPELNITKDLPLNNTVSIQIPTNQARKLTFQCGMGMYKSSVVIL